MVDWTFVKFGLDLRGRKLEIGGWICKNWVGRDGLGFGVSLLLFYFCIFQMWKFRDNFVSNFARNFDQATLQCGSRVSSCPPSSLRTGLVYLFRENLLLLPLRNNSSYFLTITPSSNSSTFSITIFIIPSKHARIPIPIKKKNLPTIPVYSTPELVLTLTLFPRISF